jgi:quinol monooxygenase YgiN
MILVTSQITCVAGQEDAFIAAAQVVSRATLAEEPGCLAYDCTRDLSDPSRFMFVEEWQDGAAIRDHVTTSHFAEFNKTAGSTIANQVTRLHTVEKTRTL